MKRCLAILCLFVVMFQSMSQLFILGSFYLNRDYISANVCVNRFDAIPVCKGQCYLGKELKANEKQQQNFPDLKQKEVNLYCEEELNFNNLPSITENTKQLFSNAISFYPNDFCSSVFHPPQLA